MESNENRGLWQCAKLFRETCPNHKAPAMKSVVTLVMEVFNDMTTEAIEAAEALCENCPDYAPEPDLL